MRVQLPRRCHELPMRIQDPHRSHLDACHEERGDREVKEETYVQACIVFRLAYSRMSSTLLSTVVRCRLHRQSTQNRGDGLCESKNENRL